MLTHNHLRIIVTDLLQFCQIYKVESQKRHTKTPFKIDKMACAIPRINSQRGTGPKIASHKKYEHSSYRNNLRRH